MKEEQQVRDLISVIVPVYNIMDCLPRCVESLRKQTYTNLEILLVDDGSNDGTEALVDELSLKDERIRVFHKKNGGSSSARNLGIEKARGKWLGFVDSDDYIGERMYERLYESIGRYGVRIAQISRDETDASGNRLPDVCVPPKEAFVCEPETFLRELLLHRGDCSFCTKLTDRRLFEKLRFPEGVLNEDFALLISMLEEAGGIAILPQQDYHVYYRIGSNTRKKTENEFSRVFVDIVNNADAAALLVERSFPELKKEAVRFGLYQRLDYMLHIPVGRMTDTDDFYRSVKKHLRKHLKDTLTNRYLTGKNKVYLLLLTLAPRGVRTAHRKLGRFRSR